jgi:hypothetical protein
MKRVLVASVASMALLMQFGVGFAAGISGPFDGQWTGTAKSAVSQCKSANVTVAIEGTIVIGKSRHCVDALQCPLMTRSGHHLFRRTAQPARCMSVQDTAASGGGISGR